MVVYFIYLFFFLFIFFLFFFIFFYVPVREVVAYSIVVFLRYFDKYWLSETVP